MSYYMKDSAPKLWLHRRPRMVWPYDLLTIAVYLVGLGLILRWIP